MARYKVSPCNRGVGAVKRVVRMVAVACVSKEDAVDPFTSNGLAVVAEHDLSIPSVSPRSHLCRVRAETQARYLGLT